MGMTRRTHAFLRHAAPLLAAMSCLLACGGTAIDEGPGAGGSEVSGAETNPGLCPADEPTHTLGVDCPEIDLVCVYEQDDGCPRLYRCGDDDLVWWSWHIQPEQGSSCDDPGLSCVYPEWECNGSRATATCAPDGAWDVSFETVECGF
jgi:hypothetical protein